MNEKIWITNTGKKIPVTEMTTRHIENCCVMLLEKGHTYSYCMSWFANALHNRGINFFSLDLPLESDDYENENDISDPDWDLD